MMNWLKKLMPLILAEFFKKTDHNSKIKDIEDKIPSITNLATNGALSAVDKIPDVNTFVKKADYDAKISEIETKVFFYF